MADCCNRILAEFDRLGSYDFWANQDFYPPFRQIMGLPGGAFVPLPNGDRVSSLDDLLGRIMTPFDLGWSDWEWYNISQQGKTVLTLPGVAPANTEVSLNSVVLVSSRDYSIAGQTLTFVYGLDIGDLVHVKTYGV